STFGGDPGRAGASDLPGGGAGCWPELACGSREGGVCTEAGPVCTGGLVWGPSGAGVGFVTGGGAACGAGLGCGDRGGRACTGAGGACSGSLGCDSTFGG